jgi:hypothetical protein
MFSNCFPVRLHGLLMCPTWIFIAFKTALLWLYVVWALDLGIESRLLRIGYIHLPSSSNDHFHERDDSYGLG